MPLSLKFIKSAVKKGDYPLDKRPEIAIAGRSNAGKSSLINAIANKKVAHISSWPGKTQCLNFFLANERFYFVDMPGYGFAKRSGAEKEEWKEMIEGYLNHRKNLRAVVLVTDIKRDWKQDEEMLLKWCQSRGLPLAVLLNKIDKVGQGERIKQRRAYKQISGIDEVFCVSAAKSKGINEVVDYLMENWS